MAKRFLKSVKSGFVVGVNILIFVSIFTSIAAAQTNVDSSGYVTNANLLAPFTLTNSAGDTVTNAVLVKLMPNKFIYKTPNGGEGMMPLNSLSKDLREKFGYNPTNALAADVADKQKKERQELFLKQQKEWAAQEAQWDAALKNAPAPFRYPKRVLDGRTVNLSSLFLWWKSNPQKQAQERPLLAWVHINGTNMGTMNYCWIMNSRVEDMPGHFTQMKIALENPPVDEQKQFAQAASDLVAVNNQIKIIQGLEQDNAGDKNANAIVGSVVSTLAPNNDAAHERVQDQHMQIVDNDYSLWHQEGILSERSAELENFLSQFPGGDIYRLDSFAMNTGKTLYGLPLYDLGVRYP